MSEEVKQPDLANMPLDEMRATMQAALLEVPDPRTDVKVEDKVEDKPERERDASGKFVAAATVADDVTDADPELEEDEKPKEKIRREIDLHDGSGIQVFEADNYEQLADQLTRAQANATKKIREQAATLKAIEDAKAKEKDDTEYVLGEKLKTKPKETIAEIVKAELDAARAEDARQAREARAAAKASEDAATNFVTTHPTYKACPQNGKQMDRQIGLLRADAQRRGIVKDEAALAEEAFQELSESGLLVLNTTEVDAEKVASGSDTQRIVETEKEKPVQRKKASSGLSGRDTVAAPVKTVDPLKEAREMPLDQLKAFLEKQVMAGS